jgi:hypothetical protein
MPEISRKAGLPKEAADFGLIIASWAGRMQRDNIRLRS